MYEHSVLYKHNKRTQQTLAIIKVYGNEQQNNEKKCINTWTKHWMNTETVPIV